MVAIAFVLYRRNRNLEGQLELQKKESAVHA